MKLLLNATTLYKGGPLQRAVNFMVEASQAAGQDCWHMAVSEAVRSELRKLGCEPTGNLHVFDASPARSRKARRQLARLEQRLQPEAAFTLAGPAYVKFRCPHLMGCTIPWVTHPTWQAYRSAPWSEWVSKVFVAAYKSYWFRYADAWVVQTETARRGLHRRLRVALERIDVVPNTCGSLYLCSQPRDVRPAGGPWRILCFAAAYPHKRLDLIPYVAKELAAAAPALQFQFVLTLPGNSRLARAIQRRARSLGVQDTIDNLGPVPVADGPELYRQSDVCFLPTLLETFSATYPEAMAMGLPIVTTDLAFARDLCGDAAMYFQPNNARSAAAQLLRVVRDEPLRHRLVQAGKKVLGTLPSSTQQYQRYRELLDVLRTVHAS